MNSIARIYILLILLLTTFVLRVSAAVAPTITLALTNYTNFESPQANPL